MQGAAHFGTHIIADGDDAARVFARADEERCLSARGELISAREERRTDLDVLLLQPLFLSNTHRCAGNQCLDAEALGLACSRVALEMETALYGGVVQRLGIGMRCLAFGACSEREQRALRHALGHERGDEDIALRKRTVAVECNRVDMQ